MARPINHDLTSTVATSGWETFKGALMGAAMIPVVAAVVVGAVGLVGGFMLSGVGAALALGAVGAVLGGATGTFASLSVAAPAAGIAAGVGAVAGLGHGASKVSKEYGAYQSKAGVQEQKMQQAQMIAANAGLQQGYQAGFQEGQQYAVQQIQQELQQQAMQQQAHEQKPHAEHELPANGHVAREMQRRGGQQHASKADTIAHQKEQASQAGHQVG